MERAPKDVDTPEVVPARVMKGMVMVREPVNEEEEREEPVRVGMRERILMSEEELNVGEKRLGWDDREDTFAEPFADFRWQISYQETLLSRVKQVTVTVLWGDPDRNEQVRLISFVPTGGAG